MGAKLMCAAFTEWKTTVTSLVTSFFLFVLFDSADFAHFPILVHLAKFFAVGGFAAFGIVSKDSFKFGAKEKG